MSQAHPMWLHFHDARREQSKAPEMATAERPMSSVNTGSKQAGRFQKGRSGNPSGRPRGSRNAATLACEEALTQKAIEMALAGDVVALRLCIDRICPPRKDRPVTFPLPPITSARDAAAIMAAVAEAVAAGRVTPG
jgi:hypothetical protein